MDRKTENQLRQEIAEVWALLDAERAGRAALIRRIEQEEQSVPVEVFDSRCNYASFAGRVCNKCGRIHDGGKSVAEGDRIMIDKMQEEFEKWASGKGLILRKATSGKQFYYLFEDTDYAWQAWQAARTVPEGYAVVPKNIHPLYSSGCEKVMQLLANCPSASRFDNPQDYYQYWWELLLSAAPEVKK